VYLNIGKTAVVPDTSVIGIFDLDTSTQSYLTREFLTAAEKRGEVTNAAEDIPNSFILCGEKGASRVYLSQSTSRTLSKRMNQMEEERRTTWRKSMI
jgi:hypothetical protein